MAGLKMSEETTQLLLELIKKQGDDIEKLTEKVDELVALKNKLIAMGVFLSVLFGFLWDWVKNLFGSN